MRIGVDIDGVLIDLERFELDYGSKFCLENNLPVILKKKFVDDEVYDLTDEQCAKFWETYLEYYAKEYKARDFASQIIHKLREEGNEIYIVTGRNEEGLTGESYGKMKEFVSKWLEENKIEYDRIIYTEGSKLPYCIGNYIDVMIEDNPKNTVEISSKIPVLCFNAMYNAEIEGENIKRVYSWYEIYEKLEKKK